MVKRKRSSGGSTQLSKTDDTGSDGKTSENVLTVRPASSPNKQCTSCKTQSTPLWRSGPDGTLCNSCGMRYKRNKALLGESAARRALSSSPPKKAESPPNKPVVAPAAEPPDTTPAPPMPSVVHSEVNDENMERQIMPPPPAIVRLRLKSSSPTHAVPQSSAPLPRSLAEKTNALAAILRRIADCPESVL
ncbi:MAG: hypothetical protein SGCHY_000237 [Lobulomycetales sp.]